MITTLTIDALIDAGLSAEAFKTIKAAFDLDIENARNDVREHIVTTDAGCATPAAVRMRKMRENRRLLKATGEVSEAETTANTVTEQSVTNDNILSKEEGFEEGSKEVVVARARKKITYSEVFEQFWAAFPTDKGMSKLEAWKAWQKLPEEDQQAAIDGIPGFKKWASEQGATYRMVHACRYLSQRRFDGFKAETGNTASEQNQKIHVKTGTDDWDEWEAYYLKTKGKKPPRDQYGGWYFPSQRPPTQSEQAA